jgi:ribose-phosphate pyrophosphokinase
MAYDSLMVFTGNANPKLAADVVKRLNISLGRAEVGRFSDGEVSCRDPRERARQGRVRAAADLLSDQRQPDGTAGHGRCAEARLRRRITAAIPYFGYARQDRRPRSARVPITAKVVANMLQTVGVQRVLTVDLHADQIQGFFDIPVDNIYAAPILLGDIWKQRHEDLLVVSPDVGGVVRARALAKRSNPTWPSSTSAGRRPTCRK